MTSAKAAAGSREEIVSSIVSLSESMVAKVSELVFKCGYENNTDLVIDVVQHGKKLQARAKVKKTEARILRLNFRKPHTESKILCKYVIEVLMGWWVVFISMMSLVMCACGRKL